MDLKRRLSTRFSLNWRSLVTPYWPAMLEFDPIYIMHYIWDRYIGCGSASPRGSCHRDAHPLLFISIEQGLEAIALSNVDFDT